MLRDTLRARLQDLRAGQDVEMFVKRQVHVEEKLSGSKNERMR